jgi:hypothetical protein
VQVMVKIQVKMHCEYTCASSNESPVVWRCLMR